MKVLGKRPSSQEEETSYANWNINRSTDRNLMSGQITVTIENTEDFFYPRHSWLLVEGNLVKAAAGEARYQDADLITLTNNAIMYLFTNIKYSVGGMEKV